MYEYILASDSIALTLQFNPFKTQIARGPESISADEWEARVRRAQELVCGHYTTNENEQLLTYIHQLYNNIYGICSNTYIVVCKYVCVTLTNQLHNSYSSLRYIYHRLEIFTLIAYVMLQALREGGTDLGATRIDYDRQQAELAQARDILRQAAIQRQQQQQHLQQQTVVSTTTPVRVSQWRMCQLWQYVDIIKCDRILSNIKRM